MARPYRGWGMALTVIGGCLLLGGVALTQLAHQMGVAAMQLFFEPDGRPDLLALEAIQNLQTADTLAAVGGWMMLVGIVFTLTGVIVLLAGFLAGSPLRHDVLTGRAPTAPAPRPRPAARRLETCPGCGRPVGTYTGGEPRVLRYAYHDDTEDAQCVASGRQVSS